MTAHLETISTGFVAVAASALGRQTFRLLAEVTAAPMPEWMTWLVGPLGALAGLVIALIWMNKRLDRTEKAAADRQLAMDKEASDERARSEARQLALDKESREERDRLIVALERSTVAMGHIQTTLIGCQTKNRIEPPKT